MKLGAEVSDLSEAMRVVLKEGTNAVADRDRPRGRRSSTDEAEGFAPLA